MSQRISIGNAEDKIWKQKIIEESEATLRVESKNVKTDCEKGKMVAVAEPKLHKDLLSPAFDRLEKGEHSSSSKQEVKEFACLFCDKTFPNSQALGGHQNAHKHERALKKMEQKRIEEEMDSALRYRPSFPYSYLYSDPIHHHAFPNLCGNLKLPVATQMNSAMSSWLDSPSGSYGGMYMPNTPTPPHLFGMTNFLGGNQTLALPITQRPNTIELRLSSLANQTFSSGEGAVELSLSTLANQTPSSGEGAVELRLFSLANQTPISGEGERNSNAQFSSHDLTLETRDLFGGTQLLAETNVSSSSTTESTFEELDLNLKL